MKNKVVVLGGGIGGLTAAHELLERGFEVEVYELKKIPGGKSRTIPVPHSGKDGRADLPGEHGFRFFPAFYKHLPDSMTRIPFAGNARGCFDNLTPTSRIEIAAYGQEPISLPSRMPRSLEDLILIFKDLFETKVGLLPGELEFFAGKIWQVMTSCEQRRLHELENVSWWEFVDAENKSPAYRKYLAEGLSRSLVAARAQEGSARTIGQVQVHLMFGLLDSAAGSTDRVLNGPTSPQLLLPWISYLESLGGKYMTEKKVVSLSMKDRLMSHVTIEDLRTKQRFDVHADYFVSALPVEVMGPLVTKEMEACDGDLASIEQLEDQTRWMNGIQFFLKRDVPVTHGHVLYVDSPWAITSISEAQFWSSVNFSAIGDGSVRGILSVDVSDWNQTGDLVKKFAKDASHDEIIREVWYELEKSLNVNGQTLIRWDDVHSVFIDTDIEIPHAKRPHPSIDLEPLYINEPGSWESRPDAASAIANFFLAADYVQTNSDLACMEAANEAARRAVNAILLRSGSKAAPCKLFDMGMPALLFPWRLADEQRFAQGKPWAGERSSSSGTSADALLWAMRERARTASSSGSAGLESSIDPSHLTLRDDAYHLSEFLRSKHLFWFTEWWYFNFVDKKTNRSGMVTFAVFNGGDVDFLGISSLNAAFFDPDGSNVLKMDYHGLGSFWASEEKPHVTLAGSRLRALDERTIEIAATTEDGSITMELVYTQADAPQLLANDVHAEESWQRSSWLAQMPSAKVNGWITVHGTRYDLVDATGYHDHDWGQWLIPFNTWAWAAFSIPDEMSFDVGLHAAFQKSTAYFRLGELRLYFPQDNFQYQYKNFDRWKLFYEYPTEVDFSAVDSTGNYRIELVWKVENTAVLWKYPLLVFEQTARFTGKLEQKNGDRWETVKSIDTTGFSEFTREWDGSGPT